MGLQVRVRGGLTLRTVFSGRNVLVVTPSNERRAKRTHKVCYTPIASYYAGRVH